MSTLGCKNNFNFWRYLTNFWSMALYILVIYDFAKNNGAGEMLGPVSAIYAGVLAIYATNKEFERWRYLNNKGKHPGEAFVIAWTILIFTIIVIDFIFSSPYKLPSEITSVYIAVLGVLALTRKSKSLHEKKGRGG